MSDKLTKEQVGYVDHASMNEDCDDCRHYREGGTCSQVEGKISPEGWCRIFNATNPFHILGPAAEKPCESEIDEKE